MGVRRALGAPVRHVVWVTVREAIRITAIGAAVGAAGAWGMAAALESWLYGVSAHDPIVLLGTTGLTVGVAVIAAWTPARDAARDEPIVALRD